MAVRKSLGEAVRTTSIHQDGSQLHHPLPSGLPPLSLWRSDDFPAAHAIRILLVVSAVSQTSSCASPGDGNEKSLVETGLVRFYGYYLWTGDWGISQWASGMSSGGVR